jgi:hypothetical protein
MTRKLQTPIPAGALFTVTTGIYSDYYVRGVFRAKEELNVATLIETWLADHPNQKDSYLFDEIAFIRSFIDKIEPVECLEFWLNESDFTLDTFSGITP